MDGLFSQGTLFSASEREQRQKVAPLALRLRPTQLSEFVGQEDIVGADSWLYQAIQNDRLSSLILYGPPGTGKTSLAKIIAKSSQAYFTEVSAVTGTVKELREQIKAAESRLATRAQKTILFIDEIHRFSRSQQDALLHAVEDRIVTLVGATTENPYFEVNSALLSRSRVLEFKPLSSEDIGRLIDRALLSDKGLKGEFDLEPGALKALIALSAGDARHALTLLEAASDLARFEQKHPSSTLAKKARDGSISISLEQVKKVSPKTALPYDKTGDVHYDVISAFIKSMRGSDPDAALFWLARMISAGEDPRFIARRIFILASEDIGNADPRALLIAEAAFKATEVIGYPECRINLAQAAVYMALAPKSNASYLGINRAQKAVEKAALAEVPEHLRDRHRPGSEDYSDYLYPHASYPAWVDQRYLPEGYKTGDFFEPKPLGWEKARMDKLNEIKTYVRGLDQKGSEPPKASPQTPSQAPLQAAPQTPPQALSQAQADAHPRG